MLDTTETIIALVADAFLSASPAALIALVVVCMCLTICFVTWISRKGGN